MFKDAQYHELIRKTIVAFGTLFNDMYIYRKSSTGKVTQKMKVPLAYGPKQDLNRFLPIIIEGCKNNKKFPCSKGNQLRDFLHVRDLVDIIIKSLMSNKTKGQIINAGTGKPKKLKTIINYVRKISKGGYPQFGKVKLRKDEILKIYPSMKKIKKLINWTPRISFEKGVKNTIKFYNE